MSEKWICPSCCWYDDDKGKCNKGSIYSDPDTGKVGRVTVCNGFVRLEYDGGEKGE